MKYTMKAVVRVFSLVLAATLLLTAFPTSTFAAIDDPLSGVTGSGWDDFGDDPPGSGIELPGEDHGDRDTGGLIGGGATDEDDPDNSDDSGSSPGASVPSDEKEDTLTEAAPANGLSLGASGDWVLPDDVAEKFIAFLESVERQMNKPAPRAAPGDTGMVSWKWGDEVHFTTSKGHYIGNIPRLTLNTSNPGQDIPFCAAFGVDPNTSSPYTAKAGSDQQTLKLLIAHKEGKASTIGTQLAIWSITNSTAFREHPEAAAAWAAAQTVSTAGYSYLEWTGSAPGQPFYTLEKPTIPPETLKIIKKSTSGKLLEGATFSVSGPGVNEAGLVTNSRGEILVDIPSPGGTFTVTETAPPNGYLPAEPGSKTVTIDAAHPSGTVTFENKPKVPEDETPGFRIEVEVEVETKVETFNTTEFEYSDAIGQITVRKHDQDGMSLDGALFNIRVEFTNGESIFVENWEVDNGARLFTWTHPDNNHDPAKVTVWEVQPPRYYKGDLAPKTAQVRPTYTRVTVTTEWTNTHWTYFYRYTVIEIDPSGKETKVDSWTESRDEFEVSTPVIQSYPDFIEGDRETTVTFVNQRITGDIIVTKKDANTGQPLAGASVHLWGTDLGEPSTIDRTLVTGPDGTAVFDNLPPGTYSFQETQPPFAYNLNSELQTAVLQSGQVLHKEIRNYRKDGLTIKKTDQNGAPLPGAVFELRRGSGEVLLSDVTDENGLIFRDYLTEGYYIIEELQAPEGYLLDEDPVKGLYIYATDDNKQYTVSFVNKKKPSIEIIKVDGDTPTIKLAGAVFRITDSRTGQYWDIQTGADGTALLENLDLHTTYVVEERDAPQNYVNSGYRQEIVLKECRKHTITVSNHHMPKMTIIKKDAISGALLPGATFRISWNGGAAYQDITTDEKGEAVITNLTPGWHTIFETKAPEGYLLDSTPQQILILDGQDKVIELFNEKKPSLTILKIDSVTKTPLQYAKFRIEKKTDSGTALIGEYISDADGIVYLENIEPGRFLITELQAPDGFHIDNATHEVTIEQGQAYKIELTNTAKSPIYIQKVDEKGNPLMGAKFKVTTMNGAMVGTFTTGRTGYAIIPYVEPGWFVVEEIQAPDGHILSSNPVNVEVKPGKPTQVEFVNFKKPQLTILKLDAADRRALMGARIKVAKTNGEIIGTFTTDRSGLITLTDLEAGSYSISELSAPDGYILDMTPQIVELKAGETKQIELFNTAKPGLQLRKIDKLTNKPVGGAAFRLVRLESGAKRDLGTFTTGENGLFYVPDLAPGDYILTEITAPAGYILDSTPQSIYIEVGKLNTVEVYNMPYSSLRLLKIDSETRTPLASAVFKLYDEKRLEIGTYTTSALGEIYLTNLPGGIYFLQEQKAPAGYVLDTTVRQVELTGGQTTTVEWKNTALGSLRILKIDKETGKPLYGCTFLLYDSKDNLLGEFTTDQDGLITFGRNLQAGKFKIKETKAPDGYVLDKTIRSVTIREGETTEIVIENEPIHGRIQITKKAAGYNDITKEKKGALLHGAVFEILDNRNKVVDRIETDRRGLATSKPLPLGVYRIREVTAPKHYLLGDKVFYAEIKVHDDLIQFEVLNEPADISVTVQKYGNYEALLGQNLRYDFKDIANTSSVELDDFYFHDAIPTDAVRLVSISTGTWNERLIYKVLYATNLRKDYRVLEDKLDSRTVNEIDCRRETLKLKNGEYITDIKFVFGTVQPGFREVTQPFIICTVNGGLPNEYRFTNRCDSGGKHNGEWVIAKDAWVTITYANPTGKIKLPKTGF